MNFSTVNGVTIPEGKVVSISKGSEVLWRKRKYKKRLLYLESTGPQYLDIGVVGKSGVKTFLDFELIDVNLADCIIFGSATAKWAARFYPVAVHTNAFVLGYGPRIVSTFAPVLNQRYAVESELSAGKQTMIVDGSTVISSATAGTIDTKLNMFLFGVNFNGTLNQYGTSRIYSGWIEVGGVLVRDIIPVLDWDDVPCMYDKVSGEMFYNAGTGEFLYGEVAV